MSQDNTLYTGAGAPVAENDNTQSAGRRGPLLLQDVWYMEKLAHFVRERIPERVVHAKGSAAYGELTVTGDISKYTSAALFELGTKTKVLLRFSTVAGERGAADAERDVRGFAIKFYTTEGNLDIVGNNTPVFFIRDPLKFPDFIHTQKRDPYTNMRSATHAWDFWSKTPESIHQVMILHSDRGIPANLRQMNGFGSQTFSFINDQKERFWVKFHFKSQNGIATLTNSEAEKVIGNDRESSQKDLFENIEKGNFPKWTMQVQIMPEKDAEKHAYAFDVTKVWPHADYPLIEVGTLELNKNPDNYFAEVEQAAFAPSNFVPGVGASPDRMLQGRLFSYQDAHRYRLGVNHHLIPVNQPINKSHSYHRDGQGRTDSNGGTNPNFAPNRFGAYMPTHNHDSLLQVDNQAGVFNYREYDEDYYSQPAALYSKVMNDQQRRTLEKNYAESLSGVEDNAIVHTVLAQFAQVHPELAQNVKTLLKL